MESFAQRSDRICVGTKRLNLASILRIDNGRRGHERDQAGAERPVKRLLE